MLICELCSREKAVRIVISNLEVFTAIELGHIFKLGTKYSESIECNFIDEKGEEHPIVMGSYGIGVERVMACFIEQNSDEKGIDLE